MSYAKKYSDEVHDALPKNRSLYYAGGWHKAKSGGLRSVRSPANQEELGHVSWADADDVDEAVRAAYSGFKIWRGVKPLERCKILRRSADVIRAHRRELALIDAADGGNPVKELLKDVDIAAATIDYYAGLITEIKGDTIPMGDGVLNYSVREPLGVIVRISAFNHPMLFAGMKIAAPLAAGNSVIVKSPDQAPLSSLRLAELLGDLFPPGVLTVLSGGRECGEALVTHPKVAKIGLIGSVPTGRAILKGAAAGMKKVTLELGGKNALIACADADPDKVAEGIVKGMNFAWCGQSCGSTSRAFLHSDIHDAVIERVKAAVERIRPGLPTDDTTEMGSLISREHRDKVWSHIRSAKEEGARLVTGAEAPAEPGLSDGFYILPTVFADVTQSMTLAKEEVFGPVLAVLKWEDEVALMKDVNAVDFGLTAAIWTSNLSTAHRLAHEVEAGYVWINNTSAHFLGAPFGGTKQSGLGREESISELLDCTDVKNINVTFQP
ncbi:aldehyde dehydrogenase family protein [Rhizobium sp. WYJ-E13]|uniref:aldehyde dehydrogenase family protein n=1 Tax=Rhizobium sp. WYJ-E13 TaxID=2849093 RepID=UPI001C1EAD78|nr:aldehyde dehydrogenase family protein [Rhizobium sp. WYJ-E13]QWW72378.1 aldehyde dehydrogenase family protein [Rhizobium sp. WYJ-E13]